MNEYIESFPFLVRLMWVVSAITSTAILFLLSYLIFLRRKLWIDEKRTKNFSDEYSAHIVSYIYNGNSELPDRELNLKIEQHLRECSKSPFKRRILVSILIGLQRNISGDLSIQVKKLYKKLELTKFALKKLKSRNWGTIVRGIREITIMRIKSVDSIISKFIDHPVIEVRTEAQLYKLRLFRLRGLEFIDKLTTDLSEWQQIQLLDVMQHFEKHELPDVQLFLRSKNTSVVRFGLKLVKMYSLTQSKYGIIKLLKHADQNVRLDAIGIIAELSLYEAKDYLKIGFDQKHNREQLAIMKSFSDIGTPDDRPFLMSIINNTDFYVRLWAMKALKNLVPANDLRKKFKYNHPHQKKLLNYVLDKEVV